MFQEAEAPRFQDNRHMNMVRLSALRTGHLYPPPQGNILGTHFCYRLSQPQGHSAGGRIISMKNSIDLPTCSAVLHPIALRRTPVCMYSRFILVSRGLIRRLSKGFYRSLFIQTYICKYILTPLLAYFISVKN